MQETVILELLTAYFVRLRFFTFIFFHLVFVL